MGVFDYIESLNEFKFDYSLERIKKILIYLGRPQDSFFVFHVAGSNGKGSTCAYLEAALRENGYKTGVYSSPHIFSVKERILVNGMKVSDKVWEEQSAVVKAAMRENMTYLTYFEFLTVLMYLIFREMGVRAAVIEAGLGGRYDATNAEYSKKVISIITSISLEHTAMLGKTKLKILIEKEQILKNGLGLFNLKEKALIAHVKKQFKGRAMLPEDFYAIKNVKPYIGGQKILLKGKGRPDINVKTKMPEPVQAENIRLALTALEIASASGLATDVKKSVKGISKVKLYGRLNRTGLHSYVSVSHNPEAVGKLIETLKEMFGSKPLVFLCSALMDKDIKSILLEIKKYGKYTLVLTELKNPRAAKIAMLEKAAIKAGMDFISEPDPKKAFAIAKKQGTVIVLGSFYLASALGTQK